MFVKGQEARISGAQKGRAFGIVSQEGFGRHSRTGSQRVLELDYGVQTCRAEITLIYFNLISTRTDWQRQDRNYAEARRVKKSIKKLRSDTVVVYKSWPSQRPNEWIL